MFLAQPKCASHLSRSCVANATFMLPPSSSDDCFDLDELITELMAWAWAWSWKSWPRKSVRVGVVSSKRSPIANIRFRRPAISHRNLLEVSDGFAKVGKPSRKQRTPQPLRGLSSVGMRDDEVGALGALFQILQYPRSRPPRREILKFPAEEVLIGDLEDLEAARRGLRPHHHAFPRTTGLGAVGRAAAFDWACRPSIVWASPRRFRWDIAGRET